MAALLKLATKRGGSTERMFALHLRLVLVPPFALIIVLGEASVHLGWSIYDLGAVLVTYAAIGFYQQAFLRPIYSVGALRALSDKGWGTTRPEYYSELARYMEDRGVKGRLPWVSRWGRLAVAIFYGLVVAGIGFVQVLAPLLAVWAPVLFACIVFPLSFLFWRSYRQRVRQSDADAEAEGYPLKSMSVPVR